MRDVTCSMSMSLDGFIIGPDGRFDWSVPDAEVFALATDEVRRAGVHLMGRNLYETMLFWEPGATESSFSEAEQEFAELWRRLPKVVFSTTLTAAPGSSTRLATGGLAEEVQRLRAEATEGDIAVGGARLAAAAAALGLLDEYRVRVYPVLVGGGVPLFPQAGDRVDLDLLETRRFDDGVVYLRYRVVDRRSRG